MPLKTIFDIDCQEFQQYFANEVVNIHPKAKEGLPKDVQFKLFRRGGDLNSVSTSKLGILSKLFILWKCLNKRIWIVVEDEHKGLSVDEFEAKRKALKNRDYGLPHAEGLKAEATFILASKELGDTFHYLNRVSTSPAYNYLSKSKNQVVSKTTEWDKQMQYIVRFLIFWESNKKTLVATSGLGMPEVYVLMGLFHGKDTVGSYFYHDVFKRAYQSSPAKIKLAFGSLQAKGFIEKTGVSKGATLRITPLGKDLVSSMIERYAINC